MVVEKMGDDKKWQLVKGAYTTKYARFMARYL